MKDISRGKKKRKVQTHTHKYWHGTHAVSSVKHAKYKRREKIFFRLIPHLYTRLYNTQFFFYHHPSMQPSSTPFIFLLSSRARFTSITYMSLHSYMSREIQFQRMKSKKKTQNCTSQRELHINTYIYWSPYNSIFTL